MRVRLIESQFPWVDQYYSKVSDEVKHRVSDNYKNLLDAITSTDEDIDVYYGIARVLEQLSSIAKDYGTTIENMLDLSKEFTAWTNAPVEDDDDEDDEE